MITLATPLIASAVAIAFMATWMIELVREHASTREFGGLDD
ncbi:hypothetical protein [Aureimonas leprariae]|nr:hypothetical protein [Aureimonas leprariae]